VFTSHVNPTGNPVGFFAQDLGETERILQQSDLAWTVLRFGSFAELQLAPAATAVQNGRLITNGGQGRIVPVSRRDCAEAAAVALTTEGHEGLTYDISGPEAFTPAELAALYGDVSAKPLDVVYMSDWLLALTLVGIGTPWPSARSVVAFGRAVREGWFDLVDPAFERLTGHAPVGLRDVLVGQHANLLAVG
jgi:NAD(P)H dehydrogenase (quinone)